jgi:type IV pilus assembly protein PilY1
MRAVINLACAAIMTALAIQAASAGPLALRDSPIFMAESVPPLNMLVMGRDHKLYYEAYNDFTDIDGDNRIDTDFKPAIEYFGYFDPKTCYTYNGSRFEPAAHSENGKCKQQWSGRWLNWATTSRMDALRKVLYGGYRSTDSENGETVLERAFIPQDAHGWVKEYISYDVNGYYIRDYAPYSQPEESSTHLFGSTTLLGTTEPVLRVLKNQHTERCTKDKWGRWDCTSKNRLRAWNWASIERPVIGNTVVLGINSSGSEIRAEPLGTTESFVVRVRVCHPPQGYTKIESNCRAYVDPAKANPTPVYKPIGLLQDFGENDAMKFGLITGSYFKNTDGGVLRKAIASIKDEINLSNGTFKTDVNGIISTLNRLKVTGFGAGHEYSCRWIANRPITQGECQMWGNPIAEMMYESLRYFAGKGAPTGAFSVTANQGEENGLGLPVAAWDDPYTSNAKCAKPFQTVISDINPSYDTDNLPGANWGSFEGSLGDMNVTTLGKQMWDHEFKDKPPREVCIGQSGNDADGAPTPKEANSFGTIRGLAPEEPTKQGGYYAGAVAYYGHQHDLNAKLDDQKVSTFAVALASPLPRIDIKVGAKTVTLVPFAKSVEGSSIQAGESDFQPTDQIVDFYVDNLTSTSGRFRVNFEDVEQGADHDMDAIVVYEYEVKNGKVDVTLTSEYAAGGITQHIGYVISGTTRDGIYLEVVDQRGGDDEVDIDYWLDTPPDSERPHPNNDWDDNIALPEGQPGNATQNMKPKQPIKAKRTFEPGSSSSAVLLKDPLWYAAKWGNFQDTKTVNGKPDTGEWDSKQEGVPDSYFLVTNALTLTDQLTRAFNKIIDEDSATTSIAANSGSITTTTSAYQASFNSQYWSGNLISRHVNADGSLGKEEWHAQQKLPAHGSRNIFTVSAGIKGIPFTGSSIEKDAIRLPEIQRTEDLATAKERIEWLRGDRAKELGDNPKFRARQDVSLLGDIVNSSPVFVGAPAGRFPDTLEKDSGEVYSKFRKDHKSRAGMVYVGANDGMLHAFDSATGVEKWAFIPGAVFKNLHLLPNHRYEHRYFVDGTPVMGDAYFDKNWHTMLVGGLNKGGQSIYALDITQPEYKLDATGSVPLFKWEFTDADDADLGYTFSRPTVARMANGEWAAIFGNGYNNTENDNYVSATGNATLYIVNIKTGKRIAKIDTKVGMKADPLAQSRPNGLGTPAVVDLNQDFIVDYVYAGDIFGNVWKFDLRSSDTSKWKVAYGDAEQPLPLFVAQDDNKVRQPITSRPQVMKGVRGDGMIVLFGTGKYLEMSDRLIPDPARPQTFYGIRDRNTGTASDRLTRAELTEQTALFEGEKQFKRTDTVTKPDGSTTTVETTTKENIRVTSDNALPEDSRGWYMDLLSPGDVFNGEMQVTDSVLRNRRIIFNTLLPEEDPCSSGTAGYLMELDPYTGGRLPYSPADFNGDGKFDDKDLVTIPLPNGTVITVPASGIKQSDGGLSTPSFIAGAERPKGSGPGRNNEALLGDDLLLNAGPRALGRQSWHQVR